MHYQCEECRVKAMQRPIRTLVSTAIAAVIVNTTAQAGSFSLYTESTAAAIGNYAAGAAAEAADASTGWYNPAGLSLLHQRQAVFGMVAIAPSAKLTGFSTFSTVGVSPYVQSFRDMNGGKMGYVPSGHFALPVGENTTIGFSMVAPYGLATSWYREGPIRYQAVSSYLLTTNLSPEIGSRLTDHLSVGAGIDLQYAHVRLTRVLGSPASLLAASAPPQLLDSLSYNSGRSYGVGFHAGLLALFNDEHTRIGANYQSQVRHRFNGYSRLQGRFANISPVVSPSSIARANPDAIFWSTDLASNNINLPEVVTLSAYHDVNKKVALLGSVVFTGWKTLQTIELKRIAGFAPGIGQSFLNTVSVQDYRNTWRAALGANYHFNERLMLRVGGGYDQTPTVNAHRDVLIPDTNRWAASVGAHYQLRPNIGVDLGYTHLFQANHTNIDRSDAVGTTSRYGIRSRINARADLIGVQGVWTLDKPEVVPTK
jgi:long-chain fatty acid transport protein